MQKIVPKNYQLKPLDNFDKQENILLQVMFMLENIQNLRLIQKISSPISLKLKQQYVDKFNQMTTLLHNMLTQIYHEVHQKYSDKTFKQSKLRNKSMQAGSITTRYLEWKKGIRAIQIKYNQIFFEGNIKFYKKIASLLGISKKIQIIHIQAWTNQCLAQKIQTQQCC